MSTKPRAINMEEVLAMVRTLATALGVSAPKVKLQSRRGRDFYRYREWTIYLRTTQALIDPWTVENSVLHEFAHHLVNCRYTKRPKMHHGAEFKAALVQVVTAWHGRAAVEKYQWGIEYRSLRRLKDVAAKHIERMTGEDEGRMP